MKRFLTLLILVLFFHSFAQALEPLVPAANPCDALIWTETAVGRYAIERNREFETAQKFADFRNLIAEPLPEFKSVRLMNRAGRVQADAVARILLLHGLGAEFSHMVSTRFALGMFTSRGQELERSKLSRQVRELKNYRPLSAEAIDLVGSGGSQISIEEATRLTQVVENLYPYMALMKKETPHLPLVIVTRSASGLFAAEARDILNREARRKGSPPVVDGIVMVSPTHAGNAEWLDRNLINVLEDDARQGIANKPEVLRWAIHLLKQKVWDVDSFAGEPTLILTGSLDPEMLPEERQAYQAMADKYPDFIQYRNIEGAEHDILKHARKFYPQSLQAYDMIYDFIERIRENQRRRGSHP